MGLSATLSAIIANIARYSPAKISDLIHPLTRADTAVLRGGRWVLLVAATATVAWIAKSRFGIALLAIREDEDAALVMGINTTRYKIAALALSAFFTSIAGGIHAYWITFVDPAGAFDLTLNVRMVIMAMFGGPGTVFGPIVGAFILSAVYDVLASSISTAAALLFGVVIVLAVIFMPQGLLDLIGGFRRVELALPAQNIRAQSRL